MATAEGRAQVAAKVGEALERDLSVVVVVSALGRYGHPYATDTLIELVQEIDSQVEGRELDLLMSCGEIISAVVMVQTLKAKGIEATAFTGGQAGIFTNHVFNNARILEIKPAMLLNCLEEGKVAVVAGFQGMTTGGEITTLGRGGSDTTAAALGVALKAEEVEIYTDVEGVMTADPRLVPQAKPLEVITYQEIYEMAYLGAKVVHPRAVEIAMEGRVPLRIRPTFSNSKGTLITDGVPLSKIEIRENKQVTGLAHLAGMALVKIHSDLDINKNGMAVRVFELLAEAGISVDMIQVAPNQIGFIIQQELAEQARQVLSGLALEVGVESGYAKVAIIGTGMRGVPGVMARVMRGLKEAEIAVYHSTDSHINIACLVKQDEMSKALQVLHDIFELAD